MQTIPLYLIKTKECDNVKRKLKLFGVGATLAPLLVNTTKF
jgi:hypothetical protein